MLLHGVASVRVYGVDSGSLANHIILPFTFAIPHTPTLFNPAKDSLFTMSITHITQNAQLDGILGRSPTKVSVIDFHATWCGPCVQIAPVFETMSKQYPNVNFLKCDVDAAKAVASKYNVAAMPTFIFFKGSKQVDMIRGADRAGLDRTLRNLAGSPGEATAGSNFPGRGSKLGGGGPTGAPPPNVQPGGADAGGVKGLIYRAADMYNGLDPQLKVLCWVLFLYVVLQTYF